MRYECLSEEDRARVERQLKRRLRGSVLLAARCPHARPQVIATSPLLADGAPFPTLFWLTCPLMHSAVSRLENGEFRAYLRKKLRETPGFAARLSRAESDYAAERERWAEETGDLASVRAYFSGRGGVGGTVTNGIKCLHAHLAHFLAGGDNPVGAEVARELDGIQHRECAGDCRLVSTAGGGWCER